MGKYQELIERLNRPAWWDLENDCSLLEEAEAAVRKLEEYVETGLEPCDYSAMRDALQKAERVQADLAEMLRIVGNIGLDRLMELAKAEQEGRLVVLPCKVGDQIYMPTGRFNTITGYETDKCDGFHIARDGILQIKAKGWTGNHGTYGVPGKTVFLTREEAEAALDGKGGEADV